MEREIHHRWLGREVAALAFGMALFSCTAAADDWALRMHQGGAAYNYGNYKEAVVHYEAALEEAERFAPHDVRRAGTLIGLGSAYQAAGMYAEAETQYRRSITLLDSVGRPRAGVLLKLGELYLVQGKYDDAELNYTAAIAGLESNFGSHSPNVARVLKTHLSLLYRAQSRWHEVASLYQRALDIYVAAYGEHHTEVATTLLDLAAAHEKLARYADAERLYQRALAVWTEVKGPEDQSIAYIMVELGRMHRFQRRDAESEPYFKRALALMQKNLGPRHSEVGVALRYLAALYEAQGRQQEADTHYERALAINGGAYRAQLRSAAMRGPVVVQQSR